MSPFLAQCKTPTQTGVVILQRRLWLSGGWADSWDMGGDRLGRVSLLPRNASSGEREPFMSTIFCTAAAHLALESETDALCRMLYRKASCLQVAALLYIKTGCQVDKYFTSR